MTVTGEDAFVDSRIRAMPMMRAPSTTEFTALQGASVWPVAQSGSSRQCTIGRQP